MEPEQCPTLCQASQRPADISIPATRAILVLVIEIVARWIYSARLELRRNSARGIAPAIPNITVSPMAAPYGVPSLPRGLKLPWDGAVAIAETVPNIEVEPMTARGREASSTSAILNMLHGELWLRPRHLCGLQSQDHH